MSDKERTFIRQLKITLISVLGPFILLTIASGINDHFMIKNNRDHIEVLELTMVPREILLLYVNDQREMVELLRIDLKDHGKETDQDLAKVNAKMDQIMRDVYEVRKRNSLKDNEQTE